jgi:subtilisin family serine protease
MATVSNLKYHLLLLIVIAILTSLCTAINPGNKQEYLITINGEQLHFIAQPEIGYVLKIKDEISSIDTLNRFLKSTVDVKTNPIRGLDRKGVFVVYEKLPIDENSQTIKSLKMQNGIQYIAPLFSYDDETVAIIPEILIRVMPAVKIEYVQSICIIAGCTIKKRMEFTEQEYLLEVSGLDAESVFSAVEKLNKTHGIEWATPNIAFRPQLCGQIIPNDEYLSNQWHLQLINAPAAWEITTGDPNIIVAVLDDGVDLNHPDLVNNIWVNPNEIPDNGIDDDENGFIDDVHGWDFYEDDPIPEPNENAAHGTACAGLIAARGNNNIGVVGVTWNCKIMPIRIAGALDDFVTQTDSSTAIRYAAQAGADILSNSWSSPSALFDIHAAIRSATKPDGIGRDGKGCVVFFASGNRDNGGSVTYPARYSEVIAVGATNKNDSIWYYSGSGHQLDIVAPSGDYKLRGNLWTTDIIDDYGYNNRDPNIFDYTDKMGGTSGACPIAAGVAALILSINPDLTNTEIRHILLLSAQDLGASGIDELYGYGRVDAYAAVTMNLNTLQTSTFYVDDDAPDDPSPGDPNISDPNEDGSILHPFDSIQEAIDKTFTEDTIVVLPGIYTGEGNRDIDFDGRGITVQSEEGPDSCIIDCEAKGRGFHLNSGEGANSIVDGITITNGYSFTYGGGIYIAECNPTIRNCNFIANSADYGGGISNNLSTATVTNCMFVGNSAREGGGMHNTASSPTVIDCTFNNNSATNDGGGMCSQSSSTTVINCNFNGNLSRSWGGGMLNSRGSHSIINCTFYRNTASQGAGMYNNSGSTMIDICNFTGNSAWRGGGMLNSGEITIRDCVFSGNSSRDDGGGMYNYPSILFISNCTFTGNVSHKDGGGMYNSPGRSPTVTNCIFSNNSALNSSEIFGAAKVTYSNIQGSLSGEGNIDVDPLFADPGYWDPNGTPDDPEDDFWIDGDYHLKSQAGRWDPISQSWIMDDVTSPCIDAGDPNMPVGDEPIPNGDRINMGAYGGTEEASKSL